MKTGQVTKVHKNSRNAHISKKSCCVESNLHVESLTDFIHSSHTFILNNHILDFIVFYHVWNPIDWDKAMVCQEKYNRYSYLCKENILYKSLLCMYVRMNMYSMPANIRF